MRPEHPRVAADGDTVTSPSTITLYGAREERAGTSKLCRVESLRLRDGRQMCVRRCHGRDQGVVVGLHGLLDSSKGWEALSKKLTCGLVVFDLPGFGLSDPPADDSIAGYVQDVVDGLEMLGLEGFTLVGHSLGGAIATAVAERIPDKVAALVLLAPVGFGRIHLAEACSLPVIRDLLQAALPWALCSRIVVTAAYLTMVTNGRLPNPEIVDRITRNGRGLVDGTCTAVRAIADAGRREQAFGRTKVGYRGPVLAIWGDRDRLVAPSHRHGLLAALPQARIQVWPGMGHHPIGERLDKLANLIGDAATRAGAPTAPARPATPVADLPLADAA
jgi:pimeloyl-ACP methyl ester carboxylesterase